jgi:MFS family permease
MVNIGLGLQHDYVALLSLRCLQSFGSSGTTVLSNAVTADIVTRAERGKYLAYSSLGSTLGPALGPLIGGVLNEYFGWRSTFWFLSIFAGIMLLLAVVFFPETGRNVVGNGSIPSSKWNQSIMQLIYERRQSSAHSHTPLFSCGGRFPNPFDSLRLAFEKETGIIVAFSGLVYGGYVSVLSAMPSQFVQTYSLNSLQVGLCYAPYGLGSLTSRWTVGKLVDWNFRRHARGLGAELVQNRQLQLDHFPLEKTRIQIILPLVYSASVFLIIYSWLLYAGVHIAWPLILLFFISHTVSGATTTLTTLIIDCHVDRPATACAANNLFRCLIGAAAVAVAVPVIETINVGWTGTLVSVFWIICSPLLWVVFKHGHRWRKERIARERNESIQQGLGTFSSDSMLNELRKRHRN